MKFLVLSFLVCAANAASYYPNFESKAPVVASAKAVVYPTPVVAVSEPYVAHEKLFDKSNLKSEDVSAFQDLTFLKNDYYPEGFENIYEDKQGTAVRAVGSYKTVGDQKVLVIRGDYKYFDENGQPIYISYVADENGYQPQGPSIPTPPPVPEQIARALDYIATHPKYEEPAKKF